MKSLERKYRFAIIANEYPDNHYSWVNACKDYSEIVEYKVISLVNSDWMSQLRAYNPDMCLLKPSGKTSLYRNLYQERLEIISQELAYKVYPSFNEVKLYENKRYFSYWLQANYVPHPATWVFYNKKEAKNHIKNVQLPLVGKINVGAAGNGIEFLRTENEYEKYIEKAFSRGIRSTTGPKISKGNIPYRLWQKIKHPRDLIGRLKVYKDIATDSQKGFIIIQEYIPHTFEWRAVRIGDSFFAHKKMLKGEKASGSLKKAYDAPPPELLNFIRELTNKYRLHSVAIDLFELDFGNYLVNEIQCIFGQSDSYQMKVENKIGRYTYKSESWIFEEGEFNKNESYNLRIEHALTMI